MPGTVRMWNRLPEEVKNATCSRSFNQAICQIYSLTKAPVYYSLGNKLDNVHHTRLRLGMSILKSHLFRVNYPHVDSPHCSCAPIPETVQHFFFSCPYFSSQRTELERQLQNLIVDYHKLGVKEKLAIILHGRSLNNAAGLAVASSVQKFIRNTKRFDI